MVLNLLLTLLPIILSVAFVTVAERKGLAAIQRRVGPDTVGAYGLLQPFADALKLILKETVIPRPASAPLIYLSPLLALCCSLLGFSVLPFALGAVYADISYGLLATLIFSGLSVFGILYAGWASANSFAFMGAIRAAAQVVSYELAFSTCLLTCLLFGGSFNWTQIIEAQEGGWTLIALLPIFAIFLPAALAETNRVPFDLPESESELVAGFITELSAIPFVLFFLAEYAALLLIASVTSALFLGGFPTGIPLPFAAATFGLKTNLVLFFYIWVRATLPRFRYDQLMAFGWSALLPLAFGLLVLTASFLSAHA